MKRSLIIFTCLFALAAGITWLVRRERFGLGDFVLLLVLGSPLWFLRRWNVAFTFTFLDRPFLGFENFLLLVGTLLLLISLARGQRSIFQLGTLGVLFSAMVLLGFISGLVNKPSASGFGAVLQAEYRWVIPMLAAWAAIRTVPNTLNDHRRLQLVFILTYGLANSLIIIATALYTDDLNRMFGWNVAISRTAGFARGWTSMGTGISSGILVVAVSVLCLQNIFQKRRFVFHSVIMGICLVGVLLTLSRSVFLAWILGHFLMLRSHIFKHFRRIVLFFSLLTLFAAYPVYSLVKTYDFSRLMQFSFEGSLRESSLWAAIEAGAERPALGHGPGVLYEQVRLPLTLRQGDMRQDFISGRLSALEPHNVYVLVFAERGLAGLVVFLAIIVCLGKRLLLDCELTRYFCPHEYPGAQAYFIIAVTASLYCVTWSSFLLYPKAALSFWLLMFMMLHHERSVAVSLRQPFPWQQQALFGRESSR